MMDSRQMSKKSKKLLGTFLILCLAFLLYCYFENTVIEVTEYQITSANLPSSFDGYKIVQVSDLHNAEFGKNQQKLLEKLKTCEPDILVITGDLVDSNRTNFEAALCFIEQAVAISPVYYVTGNHEAWIENYSELEARLKEAGVVVLNNDFLFLENGNDKIALLGLADPAFGSDLNGELTRLQAVCKQTANSLYPMDQSSGEADFTNQTSPYTLLLSHRPELFEYYVSKDIDLVLTGHAHGGQFRLPFLGGVVAPNQGLFPKYSEGLHEKGSTKMIISRGLGNSIIPVRINNKPELVAISLKHKQDQNK